MHSNDGTKPLDWRSVPGVGPARARSDGTVTPCEATRFCPDCHLSDAYSGEADRYSGWVDGFNNRTHLEPIGHMPRAGVTPPDSNQPGLRGRDHVPRLLPADAGSAGDAA
jgi:hypothetical protein